MCAQKDLSYNAPLDPVGIIAGSGALPALLGRHFDDEGRAYQIIALKNFADLKALDGLSHSCMRAGQAGKIYRILRKKNIRDLVLIGGLKRPSPFELWPDWTALKILSKIGWLKGGDNHVLTSLQTILEQDGFRLRAIQDFLPELLMPQGVLGSIKPGNTTLSDIAHGQTVAKALGALDIGQSVVVQDGYVLGVEAAEGTTALIKRCAALKRKGSKPILVKSFKPSQSKLLDLPTIGPETIKTLHECGYAGLAVSAKTALLVDADKGIETADQAGLFIFGFAL